MDSITVQLAKERERHYLVCNEILGVKGHDYTGRNLAVEAMKKIADLYNYLKADGCAYSLEAQELGEKLVVHYGLERTA